MRMVDIIIKKRNGDNLSDEELSYVVNRYVSGDIPDYQMTALLMAVYFQGMNFKEISVLTERMMHSGEIMDLSSIEGPKIDKHSTGGVGDKVSIPLAPLVASAGIVVPMVSGRGLGHTGGTLDKLESIPGLNTQLSQPKFVEQLSRLGVVMAGQTGDFVPADKKLYSLRDVTGTVESIPLITASIMSKKLASGAEGLVMDVKTGSGAFMSTLEDSRKMAEMLVETGKHMNRKIRAIITDMNQPLGEYVGNSLEIFESIAFLKGEWEERLARIVFQLGSQMLVLGEIAKSSEEGEAILREKIDNGQALAKFEEMIEAQGGNPGVIENPGLLPVAQKTDVFSLPYSGYISRIDTRKIGLAACVLGAGRQTYDDDIDPAVGLRIHKRYGEAYESGEPLITIYYRDKQLLLESESLLREAYSVVEQKPEEKPLVYEVVQ